MTTVPPSLLRSWAVPLLASAAATLLVLGAGVAVDRGASAPEPTAAPAAAPERDASPSPLPPAPVACPDEVREDVADVVGAQLEAFRRGDWQAALDRASAGFRDQFGVADLQRVIEGEYPVVARAVVGEVGECAVVGATAQALVRVGDDAGREQLLVYRLLLEDGAWRIAGAVEAPTDEAPAAI